MLRRALNNSALLPLVTVALLALTFLAVYQRGYDNGRHSVPAVLGPAETISSPPPPVAAPSTMRVTLYCATGNPTASGKMPAIGMVATLDRSVPFGAKVTIAGKPPVSSLSTFTVQDRIGHGSDFDVYAGSGPDCEREASVFGVQHRRVTVAARPTPSPSHPGANCQTTTLSAEGPRHPIQ